MALQMKFTRVPVEEFLLYHILVHHRNKQFFISIIFVVWSGIYYISNSKIHFSYIQSSYEITRPILSRPSKTKKQSIIFSRLTSKKSF